MKSRYVAALLLALWMLQGQREATPVSFTLNDGPHVYSPANQVDGTAARTFIVLMDNGIPESMSTASLDDSSARARYTQLLQSMKQASFANLAWNTDDIASPTHVYSRVCNGFAAQMTPQEAALLREMDGVQEVYPDSMFSLHTTYTPKYLGLSPERGLLREGHLGEDVIIGVLDGGVWPERESFRDDELGPVPARWRGICQPGYEFNASHCNRKLIGARFYSAGYEKALLNQTGKGLNETLEPRSPRDYDGHGTHTASTAAGSAARNVSLFSSARGTARGVAPRARIAVYKVCWLRGCVGSDILAAMDQAVADGVDVLSVSLGTSNNQAASFLDPIAIGAFGAIRRGVFVSCSAGNEGPQLRTVKNYAPWLMTVAATTVDRSFPANVKLGDGQVLRGESWYQLGGRKRKRLIMGADAAVRNVTSAALCMPGSLDPALVTDKIVVCTRGSNARVEKSFVVSSAGGEGMILVNTAADGESVTADAHFLPAAHVGAAAARAIRTYMETTDAPTARFQFRSARRGVKPAPVVASFSSRGPNPVTPLVLKPDISAPGVFILAAWTGKSSTGPSNLAFDKRQVEYNIISGTSMACPHVSGLAALLRSAHPDWSPAAIKSAMMTTATLLDNTGEIMKDQPQGNMTRKEGNPFLFGSGHVHPEKAMDPGLVYDLGPHDYVNFLCALNYSQATIRNIYGDSTFQCPRVPVKVENINYPSISAVFRDRPPETPISMNLTRTVTDVGERAYGCATYRAKILAPSGIQVRVFPEVLRFCGRNQKKTFTLQVTTINAPSADVANVSVADFAFLQWRDGKHIVQSPISVIVQK